jgi:hypothetical protein
MSYDAATVEAIDRYFESGGVIHRIPFGVSGFEMFWEDAAHRRFAFVGWLRKYGEHRLPTDALDCLQAGLLTIVQARAPLVWITAFDLGPDNATAHAIAKNIHATDASVRRSLELLECRRYILRLFRRGGRVSFQALGTRAPDWRQFMGCKPRLIGRAVESDAVESPQPLHHRAGQLETRRMQAAG